MNLTATISDGTVSVPQNIHLDIAPVNDAPVTQGVSYTMQQDGTIVINESSLLAVDTDVDHDTLSVVSISAPQGTLVNNHDGTWSFTPDANFNGSLNLTATVSDGTVSVPQNIHLDVYGDNPPETQGVSYNM